MIKYVAFLLVKKAPESRRSIVAYSMAALFLAVVPPFGFANGGAPVWKVGLSLYVPILIALIAYDLWKAKKLEFLFRNARPGERFKQGLLRLATLIGVPAFYLSHLSVLNSTYDDGGDSVAVYVGTFLLTGFGAGLWWVMRGFFPPEQNLEEGRHE